MILIETKECLNLKIKSLSEIKVIKFMVIFCLLKQFRYFLTECSHPILYLILEKKMISNIFNKNEFRK